MKNYKFIAGLNQAGALVEDFYTDLDLVILDMFTTDEGEKEVLYKIYDAFMDQLEEMCKDNFCENLEYLAEELYNDLVQTKKFLDGKQK